MDDKTGNELVRRLEETLGKTKYPFYFEQDLLPGAESKGKRTLMKDTSKLRDEMQNARSYCDSIGFRFIRLGDVSLAIIVFAENFSNDELIGRSVLIKSSVDGFGKFSVKTTWNIPVSVNVFFAFASSDRAFAFRNNVQDLCKHTKISFLRTIRVKPWSIDFEGKHVSGPKALLGGLDKEPSEIESKLFAKA